MKIYQQINEIIIPKGKVILLIGDKYGNFKEKIFVDNLITTAAKESFAKAFSGETANNQGIATYHAVGTGTTAPALGDTNLQTEIFRKLISVRSYSNNQALFQTYFTTSEANGVLRELGLFGDLATATANTGTLFARVAINRTKTTSDTLTVLHTVIFG